MLQTKQQQIPKNADFKGIQIFLNKRGLRLCKLKIENVQDVGGSYGS